ncbi:MAG: sigma-70 family RNA polymerase sigma factor [Pirellulales bacterium]
MQKNERADEFLTLHLRYSRRVHGFVRALVPHQPDADDVFQEVSRTLWAKFDEYQSGTNFLAWAFNIARFKILQYRRTQSRQSQTLGDAVFELIADEVYGALGKDDARFQVLAECLQKLPARDRHLIEVRYHQGQSTKSVAEAVGRSVDAIYRSLRRIHKELFFCMQRGLVEERS